MSKLQRGRRNLSAHPPCPLWLAAHAAATSPTLPGLSQQDPAPRSDPSQRKRISSHSQGWLKGTRTLLLQRDTFSCTLSHTNLAQTLRLVCQRAGITAPERTGDSFVAKQLFVFPQHDSQTNTQERLGVTSPQV